jgi:hypothetical protein
MAVSIVYRVAGPVSAISVGTASTTPVNVVPNPSEQANFAEFVNPGSTEVCCVVAPLGNPPPTIVFPVAGTPTVPNAILLPHGMTQGKVVAVPQNGFAVSAIGSAAGPSIIYITPMAAQS